MHDGFSVFMHIWTNFVLVALATTRKHNDVSAYISVMAQQSNFDFIILEYIGKKGVVENLDWMMEISMRILYIYLNALCSPLNSVSWMHHIEQ